jgi:hypothetical protein
MSFYLQSYLLYVGGGFLAIVLALSIYRSGRK